MKRLCSVTGCDKPLNGRGLCNMHGARLRRYGRLELIRRENGLGNINAGGYVDGRYDGVRKYEHIHVAEQALGKPLPKGARVHHINENRSDNRPENLVICPSEAYHRLIHMRIRALDACGHADWRKCWICGEYDALENLKERAPGKQVWHVACAKEVRRQRYLQKKLAA